ncbi:GNAT family N-acetyltransferase [Amycolatopsis vastitatis]|uniref:GNAT family N-acetyltransferase n=1 Tax=Amycolatopsis vastitatis TaxID=1905142 RepID=A0A229T642_9PSEU|nr:GNAT family N-acetyltransferase [Amycolatopsis vastitatis]OXM66715.1 GNAT family N-acetyltransferase [Amycolatopsis vastitatis]
MNAPETLLVACSRAWPPPVVEHLGEWRLRWADGFTGRANSVLAVGDAGRPVPEALRTVCDFAHDRGITPMAQVVRDSPTERAIAAEGWVEAKKHRRGHEVVVLTAPLTTAPAVPGVVVLDEPSPGWWEFTLAPDEDSPAARAVMTGGQVGYGIATLDGVTAGAVRGAVVDGWLHVGRLEVSPAFRRRGLASALMAAVHTWGAEHGADRAVLEVAEGNAGALALYAGLGYAPHHRYRYWVPAPGSCEDSTS